MDSIAHRKQSLSCSLLGRNMATNRGSHFTQKTALWIDRECSVIVQLLASLIFTCVWPELDRNEMTSNLKVEEALDSEGSISSGSGHRGRWPSCHKASNPALSPSPSVISGLLSNSSTGGHLSRSFPVYCPKSGCDSLDKGGPLRPSSEHHANKYSSPCLSNVAVSHLSLLPVRGSVILLARDLYLLSGASVPFTSLPTTQVSLSPLSIPLRPIFLKDLAPISPQRYSFVPGNK